MFNSSFLINNLLKQLKYEKIMERKHLELKGIIYKIQEKGEFKVFDPNKYGIYDNRYYISHTNLEIYDEITINILIKSISDELCNDLMEKMAVYESRVINIKSILDQDLAFKDKTEAKDFCNYINSLLIINKLKKGEF